MSYFKQLDFLPMFDGITETILGMVESDIVSWGDHNQICINTVPGREDDYKLGTGSLILNWDESSTVEFNNGTSAIITETHSTSLNARDFTKICNQFKDTQIEKLYDCLAQHFVLGRVRFMQSKPKTCLTWHTDLTPRIHLPLITQEGCLMVVENEVMHLPQNTWWEVDTTKYHTAFNGSFKSRIHLVAEIFGYNQ